jgi:hypothetical protein
LAAPTIVKRSALASSLTVGDEHVLPYRPDESPFVVHDRQRSERRACDLLDDSSRVAVTGNGDEARARQLAEPVLRRASMTFCSGMIASSRVLVVDEIDLVDAGAGNLAQPAPRRARSARDGSSS